MKTSSGFIPFAPRSTSIADGKIIGSNARTRWPEGSVVIVLFMTHRGPTPWNVSREQSGRDIDVQGIAKCAPVDVTGWPGTIWLDSGASERWTCPSTLATGNEKRGTSTPFVRQVWRVVGGGHQIVVLSPSVQLNCPEG